MESLTLIHASNARIFFQNQRLYTAPAPFMGWAEQQWLRGQEPHRMHGVAGTSNGCFSPIRMCDRILLVRLYVRA